METAGDRFYKQQLKKLDVRRKRLQNNLISTLCEIEDVDKSMISDIILLIFSEIYFFLREKKFRTIEHYEYIYKDNKPFFAVLNSLLEELHNPHNKYNHTYKLIFHAFLELSNYALRLELYEAYINLRGFIDYFLSIYWNTNEKKFDYDCLKTI